MTEQLNEDQQRIVELLQNTHVHFCTPCYGGQILEGCFSSYLRFSILATKYNISFSVDTLINESLVSRARNSLVAKFLANPKATHLMFVDADITFTPDDILRLVLHNKDVVCGAYPMKTIPIKYVLNIDENGIHEDPLYEVKTAGTGFMMIKREVIEDMIEKMPELKYKDSVGLGEQYEPFMYALFDTMIDEHQHYLSEDWTFCKRVREVCHKRIWVDANIKLDHNGYYKFQGDVDEIKKLVSDSEKTDDNDN
jgi:hypothetical protein